MHRVEHDAMLEERRSDHALWRQRLHVPTYRVRDAARFARTSPQTVIRWQSGDTRSGVVSERENGASLSYLQLVELGVVAAMRQAGVPLREIEAARRYMEREFTCAFPFAEYRFAAYGKRLFVDFDAVAGGRAKDKLVGVTAEGQLAWREILAGRLAEFEYDTTLGTVLGWQVAGTESPVRLDPRVAFGAPSVHGIATWSLRDRWDNGESLADIADDFDLGIGEVEAALTFEGVHVDRERPDQWVH